MASDDYAVVMYKVLSYLYQCLKDGVEPSPAKAQELAGVNPVYYKAVAADLVDCGYARRDVLFCDGSTRGLSITAKGVQHLEESPRMEAAKRFLGESFKAVLKAAVEATLAQ